MARKKTAVEEATPATNGAAPARGAKTAAIRELYRQGTTIPKEISEEMTRRGLSVSMPVIYTTIKELKRRQGQRQARSEAEDRSRRPLRSWKCRAPSHQSPPWA